MIIYLPCKLGERFTEQKFKDWKDGKRVYEEGAERIFKGFGAFDCTTRSLALPTIYTDGSFLSYDQLGGFSQQYIPKYKISVDVKAEYKLSDRGFPSGRTARLYGISVENGYLLADFVTNDRHEHLRYAIKDNLQYTGLDEETKESLIEYDNEAQEEKTRREQEKPENKKKVALKDLIKSKMKKAEVEDDSSN